MAIRPKQLGRGEQKKPPGLDTGRFSTLLPACTSAEACNNKRRPTRSFPAFTPRKRIFPIVRSFTAKGYEVRLNVAHFVRRKHHWCAAAEATRILSGVQRIEANKAASRSI
jgi:hypothetical protein